jgi:hypothetical protein
MKRIVLMVTVALVMAAMMALSGPASATIHPIVESYDCANEQAFVHHPLEDPAEVPGQTPGATPGDGNNELRALSVSNEEAWFGHKLNDECGSAQGPK